MGWPLGTPTMAQMACDKPAAVANHLKRKYQEAPVALGLSNDGGLVELFTTRNGETWTLMITYPWGLACLLQAGENWETIPKVQWGEKL